MAWYDFLRGFGNGRVLKWTPILYCDNPRCELVIKKSPVMYDREKKEIYHNRVCGWVANVDQEQYSREVVERKLVSINLDQALKLFKKGKLKQARKLEEMLGD